MTIRKEIIDMVNDFTKGHGRDPTKIYLTREDERRLEAMSRDEAGGDVLGDVRAQWEKILGRQVVWDADDRDCE